MFTCHKNSYLQLEPIVDSAAINRCVQRARGVACTDEHDLEPGHNWLLSEQPCIPTKQVFEDQKCLGFERQAYISLKEGLDQEYNVPLILQTLKTLDDLVRDPEKAMLAFLTKVTNKVALLLYHVDQDVVVEAISVLKTFAYFQNYKALMMEHYIIRDAIGFALNDDRVEVRKAVLRLLSRIATDFDLVDKMVEEKFIETTISKILHDVEEIILAKLKFLSLLIYCNGKCVALEFKSFNIFVSLLDRSSEIVATALECLKSLTVTKVGKNKAYKTNLLNELVRLINEGEPNVKKQAVGVLMNCTIKSKSQFEVYSKHPNLLKYLVDLAVETKEPMFKVYILQTLANFTEHTETVRVMQRYLKSINEIATLNNPDVERFKKKLLLELGDEN